MIEKSRAYICVECESVRDVSVEACPKCLCTQGIFVSKLTDSITKIKSELMMIINRIPDYLKSDSSPTFELVEREGVSCPPAPEEN